MISQKGIQMSNTEEDKAPNPENAKATQENQEELFDITEEVENLFALLKRLKDSVEKELSLEKPDQNTLMSYLITMIQLTEDWGSLLGSDAEAALKLDVYFQFAMERIPKDCDLTEEKKKRIPPHTTLAKRIFEKASIVQKKHNAFMNEIKERGFNSVDLIIIQSEIVGDIYQVFMLTKHLQEIVKNDKIEEASKYLEVISKVKADMQDVLNVHGADQIK